MTHLTRLFKQDYKKAPQLEDILNWTTGVEEVLDRAATRPDPTHAQYFTHLWLTPVPNRTRTSTLAADWADTLSIWIHPYGTLARQLGHREDQDEMDKALTDPEGLKRMDQESQRLGLKLLNLLSTTPEVNPTQDNHWREFVLAMSFSRNLLAFLTHAVAYQLADNLAVVSLQGVESLYTELEVKPWTPEATEGFIMINLLISEGLLSCVLTKTRQYIQRQESAPYTDAAGLLLQLSMRANTADIKIRMELNQAIHILSVEEEIQILDLLIGWLADALPAFPWLWPTVRNAKTLLLLIYRMDSACYQASNSRT